MEVNKKLYEEEQYNLTFEELFPDSFIKEYTQGKFITYKEFFKSSGFNINSQEDLDDIPEYKLNELDEYIKDVTVFSSWKEMLNDAASIYYEEQLGGGCIMKKIRLMDS